MQRVALDDAATNAHAIPDLNSKPFHDSAKFAGNLSKRSKRIGTKRSIKKWQLQFLHQRWTRMFQHLRVQSESYSSTESLLTPLPARRFQLLTRRRARCSRMSQKEIA